MAETIKTNKQFAKENKEFMDACEAVGIKATARQASKYQMKIGKAYVNGRNQNPENVLN